MKTNRNFLSPADRAILVEITKDGLEEHRISRLANAILLLDKGWSFTQVAGALFIDDSTIRIWFKEFQESGVEGLVLFDLKGGPSALSPRQIDELRAWATEMLPTSTTEIGQFILERFGVDYGRSGLIKLMNRIGFDWKKPEPVPSKIDVETQQTRTRICATHSVRTRQLSTSTPSIRPTSPSPLDAGCLADSAARFLRRPGATG